MESKFLLALLVAAFLPGPSHQILTKTCGGQGYQNDDILLVNELSENARYAATNDGQSYDPYNKEYTDFFADVSAANSNSEVAYAFFSNDILNNFILEGDWVQASSVVTPTTGWDKTAGGAGLLSGLQTIRKNVNNRGNGKTMKVAVVFASPMINGFVRNVSNEITSAESIGISIYLFAVGDAGLNPNLNNLTAELAKSGLNNRVFRVANNLNIADLGQLLTNQLLDCNSPAPVTTQPPPPPPPPTTPPTTQTRCEECLLTDGAPHITHETRCDWYYHCYRNETHIISTRKQCPHDTLFDKSQRVCDWAGKVLSKTASKSGCNWCRVFQHNGTIERYPYQDSCAAYLECFRNDTKTQLVGKCCRQGFYFDGNGCFPNAARCDGLRYRSHAHGSYCRTYYQCDSGTNFEEKCCPSGTGFDKTLGECVNRTDCANISCKEPPTTPCVNEAVGLCSFRSKNLQENSIVKRCEEGTYFSNSSCSCNNDNRVLVDVCADAINPNLICQPNVLADFGEGQTAEWGFNKRTKYYVGFPHGRSTPITGISKLDGTGQYAITSHYAGNTQGFASDIVVFRVIVKDDVSNGTIGQTMVVLSNQPCQNSSSDAGNSSSILITQSPSARQFFVKVRTYTTGQANVTLSYTGVILNADASKEITVRYNQLTGVLEANLRVYDNQNLQLDSDSKTSTTGGGKILTSDCGVKVGKGDDGGSYYKGQVDKFVFYTSCPTDKPAPLVDGAF